MAKGKLPEGYRGVDKIIEEFRAKNPKGKIETNPVLVGDGFILIMAKITSDDGAVGSGMSEADIQEEKDVQKAESGAIRRALLTLGYKSVEDDEDDEADKKQDEREVEKKKDRAEPAKEEKKEERTKSRFGNKSSEKKENKDTEEEDQEEDEKSEGESKFKRGSRFQRS